MSPLELAVDDELAAVVDDWNDLYDRIARAEVGLDRLAEIQENTLEILRLRGKAEGLRLALSYMREYRAAPTVIAVGADELTPR